jgi:hypothetical protein
MAVTQTLESLSQHQALRPQEAPVLLLVVVDLLRLRPGVTWLETVMSPTEVLQDHMTATPHFSLVEAVVVPVEMVPLEQLRLVVPVVPVRTQSFLAHCSVAVAVAVSASRQVLRVPQQPVVEPVDL